MLLEGSLSFAVDMTKKHFPTRFSCCCVGSVQLIWEHFVNRYLSTLPRSALFTINITQAICDLVIAINDQ